MSLTQVDIDEARRSRVAALEYFAELAKDWDYEGWKSLRAKEKAHEG